MNSAVNAVEITHSADEIRERARSGRRRRGRRGVSAHVKLQAQVEIFLVNAAEANRCSRSTSS